MTNVIHRLGYAVKTFLKIKKNEQVAIYRMLDGHKSQHSTPIVFIAVVELLLFVAWWVQVAGEWGLCVHS